MNKIRTSLGCTNCHSSNIQYSIEFINEKTKIDEEEKVKITTREIIYNCKCNNCGNKYSVNHGKERYCLFEQPYSINCMGDIKLLATFDTESGFAHGYKLCLAMYSPYEEDTSLKEETYLMLIEGEVFPVIISKKTVEEMMENHSKAHGLVINTIQSRHR